MAFDRRGFLKFAIGGAIGSLFTPIPWKLADDISIWTQNWPWIPKIPKGELSQRTSIVKLGGSQYGIKVNLVNNRPITVTGDKAHPLSFGGLDPVGACSVALLYSPSRINGPKKKDSDGKFVDISWAEAEEIIARKLIRARKKKNAILFVSGDDTSSANEIFSSFLTQLNSDLYFYEPSDRQKYFKAWYEILNGSGEIGFDFENTDYVLALGCDFLDSWGTYVRNQKIFGEKNFKLQYVAPYKDNSGVVASSFIYVSEKDLYKFALAVANYIIAWSSTLPGVPGIRDFIEFVNQNFQPERVAKEIGCKKTEIKAVARELYNSKNPIVIAGSNSIGGGPVKNILAALMLNILLNRINKKGGITSIPNPPNVLSNSIKQKDILKNDLINFLNQDKFHKVQIGFFYESNPAYYLPLKIRKIISNIPFKICFSQFMDETARMCDLILPAPYFLERIDDCFTPFGSGIANYSVADKVISPLVNSKQTPELILKLAKRLKLQIGVTSFKSLIKTKAEYLGLTLDQLIKGKYWTDSTLDQPYRLKIWSREIENIFTAHHTKSSPTLLELVPIKNSKTGTPRTGILPFSLAVIYEDELSKEGLLYVCINPKTAENFHLKNKDKIKIRSESKEITAVVNIDPGIKTGAIGIMCGFGRSFDDDFNKNKGDNVADLFVIKEEKKINSYIWSPTLVEVLKI